MSGSDSEDEKPLRSVRGMKGKETLSAAKKTAREASLPDLCTTHLLRCDRRCSGIALTPVYSSKKLSIRAHADDTNLISWQAPCEFLLPYGWSLVGGRDSVVSVVVTEA